MKKDLWLVYEEVFEKNNTVPKFMEGVALESGLQCEIKYIHKFSYNIKMKKWLYDSKEIFELPTVILDRANNYEFSSWFENNGVIVINKPEVSKLLKNKYETHKKLENIGINQPKFVKFENQSYENLINQLGNPFVIKYNFGEKGKNTYLIKSEEEYLKIKNDLNGFYICQEFIKNSYGIDVRCYFVGEKFCGAMQRYNESGDFRSNIAQGGSARPYDLTFEQIELAKKIRQYLNIEFGAVDFLIDGKNLVFCEANSNANFGFFFKYGINIDKEIMSYIKNKVKIKSLTISNEGKDKI